MLKKEEVVTCLINAWFTRDFQLECISFEIKGLLSKLKNKKNRSK